MRKAGLIAAIVSGLLPISQPAFSAGSLPVALAQQVNANGVPLAGCLLYLYVTGSVATPQNAFQDTALTQALPWPVPCDANGRLPMFYLADGSIHPRLTDANGLVQFDYPSMLVIGPSGGGAGGATIDATTIATPGDVKFRPTSEALTGWVKLNGLTIGSAASGATSRANADTQNLYVYLWTNCPDTFCPVSTGRGGSAVADFTANKQLTLLDFRGRGPLGLDDMGSAAAGRLTGGLFASGNATTPQAAGGQAAHTLAQAELPNLTLSTTIGAGQGSHTHGLANGGTPISSTGVGTVAVTGASLAASAIASATLPSMTGTTPTGGSGTPLNVLSPFILGTWHIKL